VPELGVSPMAGAGGVHEAFGGGAFMVYAFGDTAHTLVFHVPNSSRW
jgi:hypothetical protein